MGSTGEAHPRALISGIAHINLIVPAGGLSAAQEFYSGTLGLTSVPVPKASVGKLAWFDITPGGQQIHIAIGPVEVESARHPCFKLETEEKLWQMQARIYEHFKSTTREGKPREADKPGEENSGSQGAEFPMRFFARDFAGNRLEFSL